MVISFLPCTNKDVFMGHEVKVSGIGNLIAMLDRKVGNFKVKDII